MSGATLSSDGTGPNTLGDGTANYTVNLVGDTTVAATISANTAFTLASLVSGPGNLTKNGGQILTPTNTANNFPGTITITSGAINVRGLYALGGATTTAALDATGGGIQLASGLALAILRPLTISGTGFNNSGAIESLGGTASVSFAGPIVMAATAPSERTPAALTILNNVEYGGHYTLTYAGAGNVVAPEISPATRCPPTTRLHRPTGGPNATQKVLNWTYNGGSTINQSAGFATNSLTFNGFTAGTSISGTALQVTDSNNNESRTAWTPVTAGAFNTTFQFTITNTAEVPRTVSDSQSRRMRDRDRRGRRRIRLHGHREQHRRRIQHVQQRSQVGVGANGVGAGDHSAGGIQLPPGAGTTDIFQANLELDGGNTMTLVLTDVTVPATFTRCSRESAPFTTASVNKAGTGTATLSGTTNSYPGLTTVTAGTLVATNVQQPRRQRRHQRRRRRDARRPGQPGATRFPRRHDDVEHRFADLHGSLDHARQHRHHRRRQQPDVQRRDRRHVQPQQDRLRHGSAQNNASTYTGVTNVTRRHPRHHEHNALGATATAGTSVAAGATLQLDGGPRHDASRSPSPARASAASGPSSA